MDCILVIDRFVSPGTMNRTSTCNYSDRFATGGGPHHTASGEAP